MKVSLFTTLCLAVALVACGQPVQNSDASSESANVQSDSESVNRPAIAALEVVPEARPYIDLQNGEPDYFDYGKARSELGAVEARELRASWRDALSAARGAER